MSFPNTNRHFDTVVRIRRDFRRDAPRAARLTTSWVFDRQEVPRLSATDLHTHHQRFYVPTGGFLVVVGDVSRAEMEEILRQQLGDWLTRTSTEPWTPSEVVEPSPSRLHIIDRPEASQSVIRMGRLATRRDTPDYYAMVVLNTILGGSFSSRLNATLREEKGLTYGVQSSFVLRRESGSFLVGTDVDGRVTREAIRSMVDVLSGPAGDQPVTADELDDAKAYITRRFPARFETQSGILSQLVHTAVYGLPIDYYEHYLDRIDAVSLEDVARVAASYLDFEEMKNVLVGRKDEAAGLEADLDDWLSN